MKNKWTLQVVIMTLIMAIFFSLVTNYLGKFNNIILTICIIIIISTGIVFDIIGTAVLSADIKVFHSKASQKLKGAKTAIRMVKNASKVANFCNDVIGDICGIISGSLVAILVMNLFVNNISFWNVLTASLLSAITVGGKSLGKVIAVKKSNEIIYGVAKILSIFSK